MRSFQAVPSPVRRPTTAENFVQETDNGRTKIMKQSKQKYSCDICGKRFSLPVHAEQEPLCPRCRTPFVRPVGKRGGSARNKTIGGPDIPRCMAFS